MSHGKVTSSYLAATVSAVFPVLLRRMRKEAEILVSIYQPWNELRLRQIHDNCYKSDLDVVSMGVAWYGLPFTSR